MEFDPIKNVWIGNDEELSVFQRPTPGLIANINQFKGESQVGDMVFDPKEQVWKGNERVLTKFSSNRPALITNKNPTTEHALVGDMMFDPEQMIWVGNDTVLDIFSDIEEPTEESRGFTVGKEFSLTNEMKFAFRRREQEHNSSLHGWFQEDKTLNTSHLYQIRSMSIIRIINQAKHGYVHHLRSINSNHSNDSLQTSRAHETSARPVSDEEWDDVEITKDIQLRQDIHTSDGEDWDINDEPNERRKQRKNILSNVDSSLMKYQETEDDFDDIEISQELSKIPHLNKLSPVTIPEDEIFKLTISSDEEKEKKENDDEWSGLEVPNGGILNLVPQMETEIEGSWDLSENEEEEEEKETFEVTTKKVIEEEWSDVEIPTSLPGSKPHLSRKSSEEWSDVELPSNGLQFRSKPQRTLETDTDKSDLSEDEWSDVELPQNTNDLRLKLNSLVPQK